MIVPLMSQNLIEALFDYHSESLRDLEVFNLEGWWRGFHALPSRLSRFHCHTFENGADVGKIVSHNRDTIRSLHLGNEASLLKTSIRSRSRSSFIDQQRSKLETFGQVIRFQDLPRLRSLELVAINLHPILEQSFSPGQTWLYDLHRLVLTSCWGSSEFLSYLAYSFRSHSKTSPAQLKEFIFRHEVMSTELKEALSHFLGSFSGLNTMIVLMENTTYADSVERLINTHGPTLRALVLECRLSPRSTLAHDTTRAFGHGAYGQMLWETMIKDIVRLCPKLEELGTGLPWDESMVSVRLPSSPSATPTLHVDFFPSTTPPSTSPLAAVANV